MQVGRHKHLITANFQLRSSTNTPPTTWSTHTVRYYRYQLSFVIIWELVIERSELVQAPSTRIVEDPYGQLSRDPSDSSPMYYGRTRFSFNGLRDEDDVRQFVGWVRNLDKAAIENIRHVSMWWRTPYRSTLSQDPVAIHVSVQTPRDNSEGTAKVNWQYRVAQHVRDRGRSEAKQEAVTEVKRVKGWLGSRVSEKMESSGESLNMFDWADLVSQMFAKKSTASSV
ncbi:hypothetical protein LTR22_018242 [Elasticomyces elasticus]|nr:hypothetical protein LTR22_018242 [Elasticomyces elasticus]KAK5746112.1 hypothetical protein LTS12_022825 [Elasticomyces elasticus]